MTEHFTNRDYGCRCGCKFTPPSANAESTARKLEQLRMLCGDRPLKVSSWFRCRRHPAEAGKGRGALHRHTTGQAVDIHCRGELRWRILEQARKAGFLSCGHYRTFLHLDWVPGDIARHWVG